MICKSCNKSFRVLTKENLCAFCYKNLNGKWSKEFQENNNKKI